MKKLLIFLLLFCIIIGCRKSHVSELEALAVSDTNFVSIDKIKQLATVTPTMRKLQSLNPDKDQIVIESIVPFGEKNELPSMYIINYEDGGFMVMPADNRFYPILAISESNSFPVTDTTFVPGVKEWITDIINSVAVTRSSDVAQTRLVEVAWEKLDYAAYIIENKSSSTMEEMPPCERQYDDYSQITTYGPFLQTKWNQGDGYNDALASIGCGWDPQGQPYTGCVATAIAQIMRYHEYPSSFSWSTMADNYGNADVAILMSHIGNAVGMNYGCGGSGATMNNALFAFKYVYGYTNAVYQNYSFSSVVNEAKSRPVMLAGGNHAWVADGVMHNDIWTCEPEPRNGELVWVNIGWWDIVRMNWGWGGVYDGYFSDGNWTPNGNNFNSNRKMIRNITY